MMTLTDEQLEWLAQRIPDAAASPLGGRPRMDKRKAIRGIFWMLDNGAKWKDLPRQFGSKSAVHRCFQDWVLDGVFERIMREAGRCVEERDGYRLYECYIDGTFCKAKGGGDGIGVTKAGKGPAGGGGWPSVQPVRGHRAVATRSKARLNTRATLMCLLQLLTRHDDLAVRLLDSTNCWRCMAAHVGRRSLAAPPSVITLPRAPGQSGDLPQPYPKTRRS
ncbi:MAG: transposase [Phycisphaerales bacterium JB038]